MLILTKYCSQQLCCCITWVLLAGSAGYYCMYQPAPASHPNLIRAWSPNQICTLHVNWSPAIESSRGRAERQERAGYIHKDQLVWVTAAKAKCYEYKRKSTALSLLTSWSNIWYSYYCCCRISPRMTTVCDVWCIRMNFRCGQETSFWSQHSWLSISATFPTITEESRSCSVQISVSDLVWVQYATYVKNVKTENVSLRFWVDNKNVTYLYWE